MVPSPCYMRRRDIPAWALGHWSLGYRYCPKLLTNGPVLVSFSRFLLLTLVPLVLR